MASPFNGLLNQIGNGLLRPKGQMGDWQHAARTFVDDYFRLAPKAKFLYHVFFKINRSAVFFQALTERHQNEVGLLVKAVELPKFNMKTQTLNQYNRKKVVQTSHNFGPMTLRFHDDRSHIVNILWQAYYKYYYADPTTATQKEAYLRNAMKSWSYVKGAHGFDNNSSIPFFDYISLYQLNKREFVQYKLINPVIQAFNHDNASSSDQGTAGAECTMTINYEAVTYDMGSISGGKVEGFAQEHYDKSPSPLSAAGGGTGSLLGAGGVLEGAAGVFGAISNMNENGYTLGGILDAGIAAKNTFDNAKKLNKAGIKQEGQNLITGAVIGAAGLGVQALKGISFSTPSSTPKTEAKPLNIDYGT